MALIIHELTTEEAERHENAAMKTLAFVGPEKGYFLQLVVTIETHSDKRSLQILIDAFISNYTNLLPDYGSLELPWDRKMHILVWAREVVSIFVRDIAGEAKSQTITYEVPPRARRVIPEDIERDTTWLAVSN